MLTPILFPSPKTKELQSETKEKGKDLYKLITTNYSSGSKVTQPNLIEIKIANR